MTNLFSKSVLAGAAAGLMLAAVPASAMPHVAAAPSAMVDHADRGDSWQHGRDRRYDSRYDSRYDGGQYGNRGYYNEPAYANTRVWQGRDGRQYCRRPDGTTGLLIGGAVGGLAGHEIAGRGDRTLGAIIGAAGGALLGRAIDRGNSRCR